MTIIDTIIETLGARWLLSVAIALLILAITMSVTIEIQSAKLEAAVAKNTTLTVQLQDVGKQITAQNGAIDQMLDNAAKAADRLHAAEVEAGKVRIVTQERIQFIEHSEIPVTCPEAVTWGAGHAIEIGKRWEGERQ